MTEYPEHEKLARVSDLSHQLGAFIDWLTSNGYVIAQWVDHESRGQDLYPAHKSINQWLAEFYGIDLNKIEAEKRAMLEAIRAQHKEVAP